MSAAPSPRNLEAALAGATVHVAGKELAPGVPKTDPPDLLALTRRGPVLLVLLRHMGCTFCREAMADIAQRRGAIEASGVRVVLAHMSPVEHAQRVLARYGLAGVLHTSDPHKNLYQALDLQRGTLAQLFGLRCFTRGIVAGLVRGHLVGRMVGDGFQMPGVFLLRDGRVLRAFRHASAADRPDYGALACPV
jgi:hypothetical protein